MAEIIDVDTTLYQVPRKTTIQDATQTIERREFITVEVETDDDVQGLGFTYTIGRGGKAVSEFLDSTLQPLLIGETPSPYAVQETLREATAFVGREGISELAISAVDIAVWDNVCRRLEAPLYSVVGGSRREVDVYDTSCGWLHYDEEELVANVKRSSDNGFAGVKMKVGREIAEDVRRIKQVREVLPSDRLLMIDANCAYTLDETLYLLKNIAGIPVRWLEEPLAKGDYSSHAQLRDRTSIPIALGENLYNETQFSQAIEAGSADVLQPDVCRVGGISSWISVAHAARLHDMPISPHTPNYVLPIHLHLACAFDTVSMVEFHFDTDTEFVEGSIKRTNGRLTPPTVDGHGMRFKNLGKYQQN